MKKIIVKLYNFSYYSLRSLKKGVQKIFCMLFSLVGIAKKEVLSEKDHFNSINRQVLRHKNLIEFFSEHNIPKNVHIIDVGCGQGWTLERLFDKGYNNLSGCDWTPKNELSSHVQSIINYKQTDINKQGLSIYSNETADVILCSEVIEHIENPALLISELSRVIKPNGFIFLTLPNAFNIFERFYILWHGNSLRYRSERASGPYSHISMLPYWILESLCDRAKLNIVNKGKGVIYWNDYIWFPNKRFGHFWSYSCSYLLKRK